MERLHNQVKEFMELGEQPVQEGPTIPDPDTISLGIDLIDEEFTEMKQAIVELFEHEGEVGYFKALAKIADAIGDLLYVAAWNGIAWGFPMPEIMEAIQKANIAKFGPGSWKDENGKVRKPPGWRPPDIEGIIRRYYEVPSQEEIPTGGMGNFDQEC